MDRKGTSVAQAQPMDDDRGGQAGGSAESLTPETLVRTYALAVLGVCLAHMRNIHDGEDVMQDVFIKAFTKLDTLRDRSRVRGWLLQTHRPVL